MPTAESTLNTNNPEERIASTPSAGAILKQLRSEKDLSIQEVAVQLRLDPRVIRSLEADEYDSFPADTYIRGYLRSYAKLLGANGDKIIQLYQNEAPEPPEIIPDVKHPTQVSSSDKPVKAFTYLVTFILVLLVLIWWWQSNFMIDIDSQFSVEQEPAVTGSAPETPEPAPEITPEQLDTARGIEEDIETNTEQQLQLESSDAIGSALMESRIEETASTPEPVEVEDQPAEDSNEIDDNIALPGPDIIYLRLNADCWIEVHDRYGKEVYVNLARTGEEIYLNGFAPFQVKLGNAQGVVIQYNGEFYDPAPYTTKGIARFTLGD